MCDGPDPANHSPLPPTKHKRTRTHHAAQFDIPVRVDWAALDPAPLRRYLGLEAPGVTASPSADGSTHEDGGAAEGKGTDAEPGALTAADARLAADPRWGALPPFSDRVLVFVRGVGVARARGQFYSEKLDLIASYALLEPLARAAGALWRAAGGAALARAPALRPLVRKLLSGGAGPYDAALEGLESDDDDGGAVGGSSNASGDKAAAQDGAAAATAAPPALSPALARLEAAAAAAAAAGRRAGRRRRVAKYVARRTLRTLLPGVADVALALPREELLTEPTCELYQPGGRGSWQAGRAGPRQGPEQGRPAAMSVRGHLCAKVLTLCDIFTPSCMHAMHQSRRSS